jgi:photosystem II stability/assembly factor-like uncharacterized protein
MHIPPMSRVAWIPAVAAVVAASTFAARGGGVPEPLLALPPTDTGWVELPMRGRIEQLDVGPDGRVWMVSMQGEIFAADSVNGDWRLVSGPPPLPDDSFDLSMRLPGLNRVTWLDRRTAIASGYLGQGDALKKDRVLRTTDGGMRWDTVSFGDDQWIYDAFADRNGGVWMGGSKGALVFSGDSGRTWRTVTSPFDGSGRLHSIWIEDGRTGVVASLGNALRLTRDGGRSWAALPTPFDQRKYTPPDEERNDHRIEAVALIGDNLWVAQEGHVFISPVAQVAWTEVAAGDPLWTFAVDRASGTVYALSTTRRVYEIAPGAAPLPLTRLHAPAGHLAVRDGVVYAKDELYGLYRISRDRVVYSRPLTRAATRPRLGLVATTAGVTWGTSGYALYSTVDSGRTWRLGGISPQGIAGMQPLDGGRMMVWNRHGFNAVFDPARGALDKIPALGDADVVGVIAADSLWVAFGGGQAESARRVDVGRTFLGGEFAGSGPNGFIYVSRDRGRSWMRVHEWVGHGILGVFVHPDRSLTLLSYLGSIRRLIPIASGYRVEDLVTASPRNRDSVPYVQTLGAMYFNGRTGWIDGWIHHLGNRRYVTSDGGRTWSRKEPRANHYQAIFPGLGGWVGNTGHRLFWIVGGTEREIFGAGGREARHDSEAGAPTIRDAAIAADGSVTVLLRRGVVRRVAIPR